MILRYYQLDVILLFLIVPFEMSLSHTVFSFVPLPRVVGCAMSVFCHFYYAEISNGGDALLETLEDINTGEGV